jgi:hypothetical protein
VGLRRCLHRNLPRCPQVNQRRTRPCQVAFPQVSLRQRPRASLRRSLRASLQISLQASPPVSLVHGPQLHHRSQLRRTGSSC